MKWNQLKRNRESFGETFCNAGAHSHVLVLRHGDNADVKDRMIMVRMITEIEMIIFIILF